MEKPENTGETGKGSSGDPANVKVIFALSLAHFIGDFYSAFVNPLMPVFVERFSLSLTQVGLIAGIYRLLAFVVQPSVGYMADRYRTRFFVLGGPLLTMVFVPLVGVAPSFTVLLLFISLGSIGSSMFHPTAAGMVSTFAGSHFGLCLSILNMGGTLAFGVGPLFITYLVGHFGLSVSPLTTFMGLAVMVFLFRTVPVPEGEGLESRGFIHSIRELLEGVWKPIALIWVISVVRTFVSQSFLTFIPVLHSREGHSLFSAGVIVSLYNVAGALSGVISGHLSDRIGYKPIFYSANLLATVFLGLLLYLPGPWIYANAFLSGFFIMATLPLAVAMAQEFAPRGKSMISSLMMGLAYGTGGMMSPVAGKFADLYSIRSALSVLAILPVLTIFLIYRIPEKNHKIQ
jgi:MFS transporter, FSR family, fosmidomycin resistance protein